MKALGGRMRPDGDPAGGAALVAAAGVARQGLGLQIDEVAQDVDALALEGAAHLDRRNDLERSPAGSCDGWPHSPDGVAVRQRWHLQLTGDRTLHDLLGRDSAVGRVRMDEGVPGQDIGSPPRPLTAISMLSSPIGAGLRLRAR